MKSRLFGWLTCVVVFAGFANVVFADPTVDLPSSWWVGEKLEIEGEGFPSGEYVEVVITFSDSSFQDDTTWSNVSGGEIDPIIRLDVGAPAGEATFAVYFDEAEIFSDTFEVMTAPALFVPDPIDAEESFWIDGYGFNDYQNQDIYFSIIQGDYRMNAADDEPNVYGFVTELKLSDEDDWFASEATVVASLADGTILATTTVDVINSTGSEPVFESEFAPAITVTPPGTFREGDSFDVDLNGGIPESTVTVQVIGDNETVEYDYGSYTTDEYGELSAILRMPLVLSQGVAQDGRTIRVLHGGYSEDFQVTLNEGVRFGLETDNIQEGDVIDAEIRNGVGESQVIFQIVHDNEVVVHEFGFLETDGSGYGDFEFTIPTVLDPEFTVDGFTFRMIHAGLIIDKSVTITEGLRMYVGAQNVREGHNLDVAVYNGTASTSASIDWWLDSTFVQSQAGSFATNGSGDGEFTITVPDVLQSMAESDFFTLKVTHDGNTFELGVTVYQTQTPDPGDSQAAGLSNGNGQTSITQTP